LWEAKNTHRGTVVVNTNKTDESKTLMGNIIISKVPKNPIRGN